MDGAAHQLLRRLDDFKHTPEKNKTPLSARGTSNDNRPLGQRPVAVEEYKQAVALMEHEAAAKRRQARAGPALLPPPPSGRRFGWG
eukprot:581859-Prymnesium_polylepis.1